jgi:hypothetical protein
MDNSGKKLAAVSGVSFFVASMFIFLILGFLCLLIRYFIYIVIFIVIYAGHIVLQKYLELKFENMRKNMLWKRLEKQIEKEKQNKGK